MAYCGESHADKRLRMGEWIGQQGADAAVITALPSIAWLLNIRGRDVSRSPLTLASAIVRPRGGGRLVYRYGQTGRECC